MTSPVRAGLGGEAAHVTEGDHRRLVGSQSGCPIKAKGSGSNGLCTPQAFKDAVEWAHRACLMPAHPFGVE
jgi:hypothetical protein